MLDAGQQARVVAAAPLAVLTAVGVPAVRREWAVPAVSLLVPGDEKRAQRLVAGGAPARAVEVDEGRQGARARPGKGEDIDPVRVRDGDRAVARAEVDAVPDGLSGRG
jgi:hypothetical protein